MRIFPTSTLSASPCPPPSDSWADTQKFKTLETRHRGLGAA